MHVENTNVCRMELSLDWNFDVPWPFRRVASVYTFVEEVVPKFLTTFLEVVVLKMLVFHYGEIEDGSPHDNKIKSFFSNY